MQSPVRTSTPWIARLAADRGVHYGWLVAGVTFLTLFAAAGIGQSTGVVIKPLELEFGWTRSQVSAAVFVSFIAYGLGGPFGGRLMDRFGPRQVMLVALVITLIGSLGMVLMHTLAELFFWRGIVVGVSSGMLAVVLGATVANRWFVKKRGLVTGLMGAGMSAGSLVFIPTMMNLVLTSDWRAAILLPIVVIAVLVVPLAFAIMRNGPAELGLEPYGQQPVSLGGAPVGPPPVGLGEAMRTADFWLLAGSFFTCGFTSVGLIGTHLIPHAVEHGFTEVTAANVLAMMGALNIVGAMASGYLTDRFNPRILLATYYGLRALSLVLLPLVADVTGLILFGILFGLDWIATIPPTTALTTDRFGKRSFGSIFGWISFSHQVGSALAALGAGIVRDALGDYQLAFIAAGALGFIAAGLSLRIATGARPTPAPLEAGAAAAG